MKKRFYLVFAIFATIMVILSCRKEIGNYLDSEPTSVSLEAAKNYYALKANLNALSYRKLMSTGPAAKGGEPKLSRPFYRPFPKWKQSWEVNLTGGGKLLIAPTAEKKLIDKSYTVRRVYIFKIEGENVIDGEIVEFLAKNSSLKENFNEIASLYDRTALKNFSGAIMRYDLNYFPLSGKVFEHGKIVNNFSQLVNLEKAKTTSVSATSSSTASDGQYHCYELYWCYGNAQPGDAGCTFLGYSDSCWDWPSDGSGSGSGSTSSPPDAGGGPPYGGNTPTATAPANNVQFLANITTTNLSPCFKRMLDSLLVDQAALPSFIGIFSNGTTPGFNWVLDNGILPPNTNGTTAGNYDMTAKSVTTTFDRYKFTEASDLAIMRTLIHEGAHAYLVSYFKLDPLNATKEYAAMVDAYGVSNNQEAVHHAQFVTSFVNQIAGALQAYGDRQGYTFSSSWEKAQFYEDLSWGGLTETKVFKDLPATTRTRIENRLNSEQYGKDKNGNDMPIKGTDGGC